MAAEITCSRCRRRQIPSEEPKFTYFRLDTRTEEHQFLAWLCPSCAIDTLKDLREWFHQFVERQR